MVFLPPTLLLIEPPEQLLSLSMRILPLFHLGSESDSMVQNMVKIRLGDLGFLNEDEKEIW